VKNQKQTCLRILKEFITEYDMKSPMPYDATHFSFNWRQCKWYKFEDGKWMYMRDEWRVQHLVYGECLSEEMVNLEKVGFHVKR